MTISDQKDSVTHAANQSQPDQQATGGQAPADSRTPWTVKRSGPAIVNDVTLHLPAYVLDVNGREVAVCYASGDAAAEAIATAVNHHVALMDALRAFCGDHEATGFECAGLNAAYRHAHAVLAKVGR